MKKFSNLFSVAFLIAILALVFVSCNKEMKSDQPSDEKVYALSISGQFVPEDGDITLKSAPLVGGHEFIVYRKIAPATVWSLVDGTEFLPGSDAFNDWQRPATNPNWFAGDVYITYCPVLPLRVVLKATVGDKTSAYSYLGITDVTPSKNAFPITVKDRRLGDKLTLNTSALTNLPGYTNMTITMSYTKSIIDINNTIMTSPVTDTTWPVYVYSGTTPIVDQIISGPGDVVAYDGLDSKITGTITIKINVDNTVITKTVPASDLGHGMAITLKTSKVGWYDSGIIGVTENDITTTLVDVTI